MTRLAVGVKCGTPGSPPFSSARSRDDRAAMPKPLADLPKKYRRVISVLGERRIHVEQHARDRGARGELVRIKLLVAGSLALLQVLRSRGAFGQEAVAMKGQAGG